MKNILRKECFLFFSLIFFPVLCSAQEETATNFKNIFSLHLSMDYNFIAFEQTSLDHTLMTNRPWDFGIGLGIFNISIGFSFSIPFLYDQNYKKSQTFDVNFNSYNKNNKHFFYGYIKYYSGFNDGAENEYDLTILNSGLTMAILFNRDHSIRSVYKLDRRQNVSNGSLLIGGGLFLSSIHSENSDLSGYSERQITFHTGPNIGYSYTWVFGNFFINALSTFGINFVVNNTDISAGLQILPKFSFGYHGKKWSFNIYSDYSYFLANFDTTEQYNILSGDAGFSFVRRF